MSSSMKQPSECGQHKQRNGRVAEKEKETEAVRLLTKRDDLLTSVPGEWEANGNVMATESRGNGGDHNRDDRKKRPFDGGAHKRPNDRTGRCGRISASEPPTRVARPRSLQCFS